MTCSVEPAVGIDLGTTFSVLAHLDTDGKPRTIVNEEGELITPSAVFFDRDAPIVGREALRAGELEPQRLARFAKRDVGQRQFGKSICGRVFPPEIIESLVLAKLKQDAGIKLGAFRKAVVTVPAYFNEPRRKATQDAGRLAGLEVIDIINEPTAAAIAYGWEQRFLAANLSAGARERVLVYDLGGGTFDVTLMEMAGADFQAVAIAGDVYLGGMDWDQLVAGHVADRFRKEHGIELRDQPGQWDCLMQAACDAKHALSTRSETLVPVSHAGKQSRLRLTRAEFESLTGDLVERTRLTCRSVLREAGVAWGDVTRLLLVGGATRMPMIQRMLAEESGLSPDRSLSPDEAVAHGAAIYAGLLLNHENEAIRRLSVRNVNSHTLGVLGIDPEARLTRRKVMIARNTPLPASVTRKFQTAKDGQRDVMIPVVEGGTDTGEGCTHIGRLLVTDLPPDLPVGTPVKVVFLYGQDGRLTVQASLPAADKEAQLTLARASGMSDEELAKWSEEMHVGLAVPDEASSSAGSGPLDLEPAQRAEPDQAGEGSGRAVVFSSDESDRPVTGPDEALAAFLQNAGKRLG
ncbi:MAG: Hsp70 family protein [Pirellulaceae bacterium]|jgi:molecular chaperone DnaK|nr:Hsp70 family protein [Pirellulaceae bacterium]MCU0977971.1 Hsp70 family protein [Pirellulaceae bacterium]